MGGPAGRILVRWAIWAALTLGGITISYLGFEAQVWKGVRCDDTEVKTLIYDHYPGQVSDLNNIHEISYDSAAKKRTCGANASQYPTDKIVYVIDTSGPQFGRSVRFRLTLNWVLSPLGN